MPCNACQDPTLCTSRCQAYAEELRSCTCHPDDNPPKPCPRKFAYSDCVAAHVEAGEMEPATPLPTHPQQEKK